MRLEILVAKKKNNEQIQHGIHPPTPNASNFFKETARTLSSKKDDRTQTVIGTDKNHQILK